MVGVQLVRRAPYGKYLSTKMIPSQARPSAGGVLPGNGRTAERAGWRTWRTAGRLAERGRREDRLGGTDRLVERIVGLCLLAGVRVPV